MDANVIRVGMREFREHLQQYLLASLPVAITRHGETLGFYIPAHRRHPGRIELDALRKAATQLEKLLVAQGVDEDQLVSEFRSLRKKDKEKR